MGSRVLDALSASPDEPLLWALHELERYDHNELAPLYVAVFRWLKRAGDADSEEAMMGISPDRRRLAKRGYELGLLDDSDLEDADRTPQIERIAFERRVAAATTDELWSMLPEAWWGTDSMAVVDRLRKKLGAAFAPAVLERAITADSRGRAWWPAIETSFHAMPSAWCDRMEEMALWGTEPRACFQMLDGCLMLLGPQHRDFVRGCIKLEGLARSPSTICAWLDRAGDRTVKHLREEVEAVESIARANGELRAAPEPPDDDTLDGYVDLERAMLDGRVAELLVRGGQMSGDAQGQMSGGSQTTPGSDARQPDETEASATSPLGRGAGRVALRLRLRAALVHFWRDVQRLFRQAGEPGELADFLIRTFWHTWRLSSAGYTIASEVISGCALTKPMSASR